jgi:signal transduction histidine kinase
VLDPEGEFVVFSIEDNGKGMSPEVLEKIFDPFFSQSTLKGVQVWGCWW